MLHRSASETSTGTFPTLTQMYLSTVSTNWRSNLIHRSYSNWLLHSRPFYILICSTRRSKIPPETVPIFLTVLPLSTLYLLSYLSFFHQNHEIPLPLRSNQHLKVISESILKANATLILRSDYPHSILA
ncbi:hypothetical protein F383_38080 [Gossypium arboreum]|uniref:Uncharacterized protein n=1 Tax=Gossypium arboreum TaxID=29729 RepID=A0A0B0M9Q0_GOSAR|nr:hypothetical protein F383_38080 [Gossypium arboreum]